MPAMPGPRGWLLLAAAVTIAVDRLTKVLATTFLAGTPTRSYLGGAVQLEYAMNPGAFLGLGGNWPAGVRLAVFAGATAIGLLIVYLLSSRLRARPALLGLGGILGGSVSNLADRLVHGSVVDFLYVGVGPLHTGIFNIADVAILAGGILVVVFSDRTPSAASG